MTFLEGTFWFSLLVLVYVYFLYPLVLLAVVPVASCFRRASQRDGSREKRNGDEWPTVALVVPAHNEEADLPGKLENTRQIDYPEDALEAVFVSDGSVDGTNEFLESIDDPNVRTVLLERRGGKSRAVNAGVSATDAEILVMSDASTLYEPSSVRRLVRHFDDPKVGVACGTLRFEAGASSKQTEGLYWRYERYLRAMEGRLGATLTASGAIYAVRRTAFRPLDPSVILDDFVVPMTARGLGFRIVYDPEALATEFAASSVAGEYARRTRLAEGSFRALPSFLKIPLDATTMWAFVSHKLLRWILPFVLLAFFASSGLLWREPLYQAIFLAQLAFYGMALIGYVAGDRIRPKAALLPYYLTAIHMAFLVGFVRWVRGGSSGAWSTSHH